MPFLLVRKWNGQTHCQIDHYDRETATIKAEKKAGKTQRIEITALEAQMDPRRLAVDRGLVPGDEEMVAYHGA